MNCAGIVHFEGNRRLCFQTDQNSVACSAPELTPVRNLVDCGIKSHCFWIPRSCQPPQSEFFKTIVAIKSYANNEEDIYFSCLNNQLHFTSKFGSDCLYFHKQRYYLSLWAPGGFPPLQAALPHITH